MAYLVPSAPMGGTGLLSDSAQQAPRSCFPSLGRGEMDRRRPTGSVSPASPGLHCRHIPKSTFPGLYPLHPPPSPFRPTFQGIGWSLSKDQAQVPPTVEARLIPKAVLERSDGHSQGWGRPCPERGCGQGLSCPSPARQGQTGFVPGRVRGCQRAVSQKG